MTSDENLQRKSAYSNIVRGAAWSFAMRWGIKLIGLVNTLILARLLTPQDFGIVALAGVLLAFLGSFMELGIASLLIREKEIDRTFCDTAWTLQVLQGLFLAILLFIASKPASLYFDEPLLVTVIHMYCIAALVGGTTNIGMVLFRRDLEFSKDFSYRIYTRLLRFTVVVTLAILIRNYWALVIGVLVGSVFDVILSYFMHKYRPRLCFKHSRKFLRFGLSIIPMQIAKTLNNRIDILIIGGMFSTKTLGLYNVANELGMLFTQEVILPLGRGLLPNLARIRHSPELMKEVYTNLIALIVLISLPAGVGVSFVAQDLVPVILGQQWTEAVPLLMWLSLSGALAAILLSMGGQVQIVTGHEHIAAILSWVRFFTLLISVIVFANLWGIEGVAIGVFVSTLVLLPIYALQLKRPVGISVRDLIVVAWRPLIASIIMFATLEYFSPILKDMAHFSRLIVNVGIGVILYTTSLAILWFISGRPESIEFMLIRKCFSLIERDGSQ
jgi:lipopolysaccharide exporter